MPSNFAQEAGNRLVELGLLTRDQLATALAELVDSSTDALLEHLQRRSLLTNFQIGKFQKEDQTGYFLGRFKLTYPIAAGTFAQVYRAMDIATGEVVAVKVLRSRHAVEPKNIQGFYREAKLIEKFRHPNIARMLEVGIDPDSNQHYIAMEFVEGGNLREFLRIRKKLGANETLRFACEMVEGLKYALSSGVTHRDIKPTNILFSADGQIKWVDFGLGGVVERGSKTSPAEQRTVDYAGLEKATGAPSGDPRSDIFFLGAVLYRLLTGEPAMPLAKDQLSGMRFERFSQIPPLSKNLEVPEPLAKIVDRMLAFSPNYRYQDYDTLRGDLRALEQQDLDETRTPKIQTEVSAKQAPRVLVVHKAKKVQELLRSKLSKLGYQVALMTDMDRAMSVQELKPASCMIIDLDTTGRGAVDVIGRLNNGKQNNPASGIAVIFLANEEQKIWTECLDFEQTVTLQKPLTLGPLYKALVKLSPPKRKENSKSEIRNPKRSEANSIRNRR